MGSTGRAVAVLGLLVSTARAQPSSCLAPPGAFCPSLSGGGVPRSCPEYSFCTGGAAPPSPCIPAIACHATGLSAQPACNLTVRTVAGSSIIGATDGLPPGATFNNLRGLVALADGTLALADALNNMVRRVQPADGNVSSLAGVAGTAGTANGPSSRATFDEPWAVASGLTADQLVIGDSHNGLLRVLNLSERTVWTLAGSFPPGAAAKNGVGTAASFGSGLNGVVHDGGGATAALYVADATNNVVRKVVLATAVVTTFAGTGAAGYLNGPASSAVFSFPYGVAVAADGVSVYVSENGNNAVRWIINGSVGTLAGSLTGARGFADGLGTNALFSGPGHLAFDASGVLFVADGTSNRVRMLVMELGGRVANVTTFVGSGEKGSADGAALAATLNIPFAVLVQGGSLFVTEGTGNRLRAATCVGAPLSTTPSLSPSATVSPTLQSPTASPSSSSSPTPTASGTPTTSNTPSVTGSQGMSASVSPTPSGGSGSGSASPSTSASGDAGGGVAAAGSLSGPQVAGAAVGGVLAALALGGGLWWFLSLRGAASAKARPPLTKALDPSATPSAAAALVQFAAPAATVNPLAEVRNIGAQQPPPLPAGWMRCGPDAEGDVWFSHEDGRTVWELPTA